MTRSAPTTPVSVLAPDLISAGSILAILPPLLLFALLTHCYARGLFAEAAKG